MLLIDPQQGHPDVSMQVVSKAFPTELHSSKPGNPATTSNFLSGLLCSRHASIIRHTWATVNQLFVKFSSASWISTDSFPILGICSLRK
jgi:hypothetical protein